MRLKLGRSRTSASLTLMMLLTFAVVIFQRITINADSSATGSFQSSSAAYAVALTRCLPVWKATRASSLEV